MKELVELVARRAGITEPQAQAALGAMLAYFTARLPSPVVGRIHELLNTPASTPASTDNPADRSDPT